MKGLFLQYFLVTMKNSNVYAQQPTIRFQADVYAFNVYHKICVNNPLVIFVELLVENLFVNLLIGPMNMLKHL